MLITPNENNNANNDANNYRKNNNKTTTSKSSECKRKLIDITSNNYSGLNAIVAVPLKYLSMFWRSLDLPLINCEKKVDMT